MTGPTSTSRQARSDEDLAFADLYNRHFQAVRDYCRRRVSGDVLDDVVAETFLTAWRRLDDVPSGDTARLWLYRVAYRVIGHTWRSSARRRKLDERLRLVAPSPASPADESVIANAEHRRVLDAAAHLNPTDAEVLRLAAWEQLAIGDIAAVLEVAPNAVKQRLHRARRNLAREYRRLETRSTTPDAPKGGAE
jgi:RNA polymerase sigma-70 factor (ECF subfamily)